MYIFRHRILDVDGIIVSLGRWIILRLWSLNVLVDGLETVSILLVVDIWTVEMSIEEGTYSSNRQYTY